jgi:hypothetical protein
METTMTKQQKIENAEAFVKRITSQVFKQKLDAETLRSVAEKLAQSVDVSSGQKAA